MADTPVWMITAIVAALLLALIILRWGARIPRHGDWLSGLGALALVVAIVFHRLEPAWSRGWILPRSESGSLGVGVFVDPAALIFSVLAVCVAALVASFRSLVLREQKPEHVYAAVLVSTCGVVLAWISLTPWLAFGGVSLAIFGGFIALGSTWNSDAEAALAARFARERAWGLVVMILGAAAISGTGTTLEGTISLQGGEPTLLGAALVAVGAFLQLQPFPALGWLVMPSESLPSTRAVFTQVLPAWAAFALLTRLEPLFVHYGLFPAFGWIAVISALLSAFAGLLHLGWRPALGLWLSTGFSLAVAALCFSGSEAGVAILLGTSLPAAAIAMLASSIEGGSPQAKKEEARWAKIAALVASAAGSGCIGFVFAFGSLRWLTSGAEDNSAYFFAFVLFLNALLAWKLGWAVFRERAVQTPHWSALVAPCLLIVASLGAVWTGRASAGLMPNGLDTLAEPVLSEVFSTRAGAFSLGELDPPVLWMYWQYVLLAVIAAWWTGGRAKNLWAAAIERFPRGALFVAGGYGVDAVGTRGVRGLIALGGWIEKVVDSSLWQSWIPRGLNWGVVRVARGVALADHVLTESLSKGLKKGIEPPSKLLQLIQSGDLQWYLFFAVGSGLAMLLHFLKF